MTGGLGEGEEHYVMISFCGDWGILGPIVGEIMNGNTIGAVHYRLSESSIWVVW